MPTFQSTTYLLSKVGGVTASTRSKAVEIITAAHKAGHPVRFVWGKSGSGEHATGNALDIMVYSNAAGDWIRNYVWANRARLRLRHVIWEQHITSTVTQPGVRRKMADRGNTTENHYDHNHVFFLDAKTYVPPKAPARKTISQLATEVIAGKWGNGDDRIRRLKAAGYDAAAVQAEVTRRM